LFLVQINSGSSIKTARGAGKPTAGTRLAG